MHNKTYSITNKFKYFIICDILMFDLFWDKIRAYLSYRKIIDVSLCFCRCFFVFLVQSEPNELPNKTIYIISLQHFIELSRHIRHNIETTHKETPRNIFFVIAVR